MSELVKPLGPIVWIADAREVDVPRALACAWFTDRERERLASYRFEHLAKFYCAVHAGVREQVAEFAHAKPEQVRIEQLACPRCGSVHHGPPSIVVDGERFCFSLSKSQPYFAFALASFPVGVDIEAVNVSADVHELGEDAFSERELSSIAAGGSHEALRFWVRKEALVKARGIGLVEPPASLCTIDDAFAADDRVWYVRDIVADERFCVSLCVPEGESRLPIEVRDLGSCHVLA